MLKNSGAVGKHLICRHFHSTRSLSQLLTSFSENASGTIAFVTLNNPKKRNALSSGMLAELKEQFLRIDKSSSIRVSSGTVFSSGHDIKEIQEKNNEEFNKSLFRLCTEAMTSIRKLRQPVIAEINGLGCQLVATCDLCVASEKAQFATPGVKIGLFCTTPGVAVYRAMNSTKKTMEMLLTGEPITAQEAFHYGLVNYVVQEEELEKKTIDLAEKIARTPSSVVALGKRAFYDQIQLSVTQAYDASEKVMVSNLQETACIEGIAAFAEKRNPNWK